MIGDLLLAWISEKGGGTIADFRKRADWLARTENLELRETATGRWLRDAAARGHCEVDWDTGMWSAAPPVLTRLPLADGLAVITGARRPRLLRALEEGGIYTEHVRRSGSVRDIPASSTILFPYERDRELREAAAVIGADYAGCAAARIAALVQPTFPSTLAAPPAYDSPFEKLINFGEQQWVPVSPSDIAPSDGLYREKVNGRWQYVFHCEGGWYATDFSAGVYAYLAWRGETVVRWRPESEHRTDVGTFIVDWGAPPPPLHSRALVLCSGFSPRFGESAKTVLYDNVSLEIARRVASSLGQAIHNSN